MNSQIGNAILKVRPLSNDRGSGPWVTRDPFLFCVHHYDKYPNGNANMGPAASLGGRNLGMDFSSKDGWSMYHGDTIRGFPGHPHRGWERVTVVRLGLIDHSDSLGATARFGNGDTQWVTAGKGIVHSEMFPLVHQDKPNTLDFFQIWLNLPAKNKFVDPYFTMFWSEQTPRKKFTDANGKITEVLVVAGALDDVRPPNPPPDSWASQPDADVAIWCIALEQGAKWTLPAAAGGARTHRTLHVFVGNGLRVDERDVGANVAVELRADQEATLEATTEKVEILMLQGRPIAEPVAQHGPFVLNTQKEIMQAFADYQRTRFGGWPWADDAPVHPRHQTRFAKYPGGRIEEPSTAHKSS